MVHPTFNVIGMGGHYTTEMNLDLALTLSLINILHLLIAEMS